MTKIQMVLTDMDGSAVRYKNEPFNSGWDAIGNALLPELRKKWYEAREYYYPKKELYPEWFRTQVALLKGISVTEIAQKIFPVPYAPGFLEFFRRLLPEQILITGLISSGVDFVANRIRHEAALDIVKCHKLHVSDGKFTGTGEQVGGLWSKALLLEEICKQTGIPPDYVCYIGDNENDIDVLKMVGRPYIINPHPKVKALNLPEIKDYRKIRLD